MDFVCKRCGKSFQPKDRSPSHLKRKPPQYCSLECGRRSRYSQVELDCVQCGKAFHRKAYMADWSQDRGPFCSFDCYGRWQSQNTSGKNNPGYKESAHLDLECDWCGESFRRAKWQHARSSSGLAFCCRQCFQDYAAKNFVGSGNPTWRGGNPKYYGLSWATMRKKALKRDGRKCQDCGTGSDLVVHHIKPYATFEFSLEANVLGNLVTLCRSCHLRQHNQRLV